MQRRSLQMLKPASPFNNAEGWSSPGPFLNHSPDHSSPKPEDRDPTPTLNNKQPEILPDSELEVQQDKKDDDAAVDEYYDNLERSQSRIEPGAIEEQTPETMDKSLLWSPHSQRAEILNTEEETLPKNSIMPWSPHSQTAEILNTEDEIDETAATDFSDDFAEIPEPEPESGAEPEQELEPELEPEPELPVNFGDRHEDRPDAFDYEHFVLNSAMGSFSRQGKRSRSSSSTASVSTTRPFYHTDNSFDQSTDSLPYSSPIGTPSRSPEPSADRPYHVRQSSADSISTVATFATAVSGQDPESRAASRAASRAHSRAAKSSHQLQNGYLAAPSHLPTTRDMTSFSRPRPPSVLMQAGLPRSTSFESTHDPSGAEARNQILSALVASEKVDGASTPELLARLTPDDEALIRGVIENLQKACGLLVRSDNNGTDARKRLEKMLRDSEA